MINRFSQYLIEEERTVYFTFGRMNPPTIGHGKLLDKLASVAGKNDYRVFLSQSQDKKKNPLLYTDKVKHVRKMFPKHARSILINKKVKTAIDAITYLYKQGYRNVVMVVGQDRINEFDILLNKYNGVKSRHGLYNFKSIKVVSAGQRDPDAEGTEGASGTKQRQAAMDNNFASFGQGLPKAMSNANAKRLFNDVRKGMGLKEQNEFKRHIQLEAVSETREAFVKGELFEVGQDVIIEKSDEVGSIELIGSNYVIVNVDGKRTRQWPEAITVVEKTLTPAEKKKREEVAKAIERDNPGMPMDKKMAIATATAKKVAEKKEDRWYKDQPEWGTPESTKKAKKMTPGEKKMKEHVEVVKNKISKDKEALAKKKQDMKVKHDRMMDRYRRTRMLKKNQGVKET